MRLDKFLSAARIFRSRTLAAEAISASMVFVDGLAAKSSREIKPGSIIEIDTLSFYKKLEVTAIPPRNFSKKQADTVYRLLQERIKN
jgi:ribosome-associated heat shock protein Hsp15